MKYMDDNGFISLGCNTDKDCVYKDDDGTEVYNYQSCRHYPDKGVPIMNSTNGCICSNYVTTAEVDMDNGRVYCIRNDAGSIALYVFDSLVLFLQFIIIICCLHLLLFFALAKLNQLWTKGMQRDRPVSMIKRHSLVCLFFLFMSSLCFSIFRVTTLMTGILGLRSDIDIPKRQGRLSEGSLRAFIWLAYMFLELCCLHFTILWLSTTRALFSPEANENSKSCFNVKFYKRFINLVQIAIFLLIVIPIALRVEMTLVNIVVFLTGVVIVYEFAWGCGNIIRMLRVIASWSKSSKISSVVVDAGIHEADTSTKLLRVADKIEKLSSKLRKAGGCLILFYGTYALLNYLGYEYSPTTSSNLLTIFNRGGDTCYVVIEFVLFNFLQDAIFPEYSAVIKKRQPPRFEPQSAAVVVSEADAQGNPASNRQYDYEWIWIVAILAALFDAYGIGANDVANSFSPSVGSKTLKLWQAVIAAMFCEFGGAVLLGARVTDTIRSKIVAPTTFQNNDDLLMFGMFLADLSSGTWLLIATKLELPVSTTHAIIGAIIGFSLVTPAGGKSVNWESVGLIVASWFTSPILSGIIAALIFVIVRKFILRSEHSFERALKFYPVLLAFTIAVNLSFILTKSAISNGFVKGFDAGTAVGISVGVGAGAGLISYFTFVRLMRRRYENFPDVDPTDTQIQDAGKTEADGEAEKALTREEKINKMLAGGGDIHGSIKTNEKVGQIHKNAEVFSYRTECVFALLQVITACANSFAHGSNDVANAIAPLSSVTAIYESGSISKSKVEVPIWILCLGGGGIVLGLVTYGYKIMAAMGVKMTKITPSRGFSIELGASLVIIVGSFLGIPLSTTHCAVGAIVGVGMTEGIKTGVNWKFLGPIMFGWLFTLIFAGLVAASLMSLVTFAPSQYYPLSFQNCLYIFGQLYNGTKTGYTGNVQVPQQNGMVTIIAGYPSTGKSVDIFQYNP